MNKQKGNIGKTNKPLICFTTEECVGLKGGLSGGINMNSHSKSLFNSRISF